MSTSDLLTESTHLSENDTGEPAEEAASCPNCGSAHTDVMHYCPACGQANRTHRRPVVYFLRDFLGDLFNLDTRFYVTLRDLVIRPGVLTKNYNADARRRYTPPLKFYVFASLLFFLSVSWFSRSGVELADDALQDVYEEPDSLFSDMEVTLFGGLTLESEDLIALSTLDQMTINTIDSLMTERGKPAGWLNKRFILGLSPLITGEFSVEQYYSKVLQNFSYALFFLMPILALILKGLYFRHSLFYTEHLIFSIHLHTFSFLVMLAFAWIDVAQDFFDTMDFVILAIILAIPLYLLKAMKVVYVQGWFKTILKATIAFWMYMFVLLFASLVVFLFSLF